MQSSLVVVLALALTAPVTSFNTPVVLRNRQGTVAPLSSTCRAPGTRMQLADPDGPIKIPDTFNPAEWTRRTGGGDSGVGGGLGGFRVPGEQKMHFKIISVYFLYSCNNNIFVPLDFGLDEQNGITRDAHTMLVM